MPSATAPRFSFSFHKRRASTTPFQPLLASVLAIAVMLLVLSRLEVPHLKPLTAPHSQPQRHQFRNNTAYYTRADKPLPHCSRTTKRAKSFLIVFQSRSGSTAISTHLKMHSEVHMTLLEYLDRSGVAPSNTTAALLETKKFFKEGIEKGLVPGFKIRAYHILPLEKEWRQLVREFDTRVIWQYRKNVVKSAIGTYQKEVLGDSTAISGIKKNELAKRDRCEMGVGCKFRIDDYKKFHDMLKKRVSYQDLISKAVHVLDGGRGCTLELPYEDYLYYPEDTVKNMQRFLGLGGENTEADRIKATSDSLCDVVENFDELCERFYGCAAWQPYFDDFVNACRCTHFSSGRTEFCDVN